MFPDWGIINGTWKLSLWWWGFKYYTAWCCRTFISFCSTMFFQNILIPLMNSVASRELGRPATDVKFCLICCSGLCWDETRVLTASFMAFTVMFGCLTGTGRWCYCLWATELARTGKFLCTFPFNINSFSNVSFPSINVWYSKATRKRFLHVAMVCNEFNTCPIHF